MSHLSSDMDNSASRDYHIRSMNAGNILASGGIYFYGVDHLGTWTSCPRSQVIIFMLPCFSN
jgi:hypothetical protein